MKKKILLICLMVSLFVVIFALSTSAATTNEFSSTVETIDGIDLTGMSTDTTARVVLTDGNGNYYTYPTQYIVTNDSYFTYDFSKITAKGYNYNINSVIRIEIPTNVTSWNTSFTGNNLNPLTKFNVIEVHFPENSTITTFKYACFSNSSTLQKVNVPKSVTTFDTYVFYNSSSIEEINFHKESKLKDIPDNTFKGCKSIRSLILPNSIETIADKSLDFGQNCVITELRLGDSLIDFGGKHFDWVQYKDKIFRIYAPDTFLANIDTIEYPVYDKPQKGTFTAYGSSLYSVCIYFCGDKDQLDALIAKSEYDKFTNANLVEWDPSKSDDEYGALNTWTVVYNYSECKAFYDNEHLEDTNPCLIECTRCDMAILDPEAEHDFTSVISYTSFYENGTMLSTCRTENCPYHTTPRADSVEPIFTYMGYSASFNGYDFTIGYTVNQKAYADYIEMGNANASYGVVAYVPEVGVNQYSPLEVKNGAVTAITPKKTLLAEIAPEYTAFDFIIKGFGSIESVSLIMCAYIFDGENIHYLCQNEQVDIAKTILITSDMFKHY